MKKCQSCNFENADDMRFCVECGNTLSSSPMVVDLQVNTTKKQSTIETVTFGKSFETQIKPASQNPSPHIPINTQTGRRGFGKIILAVGGIFALLFLLLTAGAAIIYFNWDNNDIVIKNDPTPTPTPRIIIETPTPTPKKPPSTPTPPPKSDGDPAGTFDKMWVDYNINENGQYGMRIHVNFSALNLKDVESDLLIRFQNDDDSYLRSDQSAYITDKGEIAVSKALKPAYDNAVYNDTRLFMPYREFQLSKGKYDLKMDVDLVYRNGDFIQHLNTYEFQYEEK